MPKIRWNFLHFPLSRLITFPIFQLWWLKWLPVSDFSNTFFLTLNFVYKKCIKWSKDWFSALREEIRNGWAWKSDNRKSFARKIESFVSVKENGKWICHNFGWVMREECAIFLRFLKCFIVFRVISKKINGAVITNSSEVSKAPKKNSYKRKRKFSQSLFQGGLLRSGNSGECHKKYPWFVFVKHEQN